VRPVCAENHKKIGSFLKAAKGKGIEKIDHLYSLLEWERIQ